MDTTWITPGAGVVVVHHRSGGRTHRAFLARVTTVGTTYFSVTKVDGRRFRLSDAKTPSHSYGQAVDYFVALDPNTEEAKTAWSVSGKLRRKEQASDLAAAWSRNPSKANREALIAALNAMDGDDA